MEITIPTNVCYRQCNETAAWCQLLRADGSNKLTHTQWRQPAAARSTAVLRYSDRHSSRQWSPVDREPSRLDWLGCPLGERRLERSHWPAWPPDCPRLRHRERARPPVRGRLQRLLWRPATRSFLVQSCPEYRIEPVR